MPIPRSCTCKHTTRPSDRSRTVTGLPALDTRLSDDLLYGERVKPAVDFSLDVVFERAMLMGGHAFVSANNREHEVGEVACSRLQLKVIRLKPADIQQPCRPLHIVL